jgi:hypothetical protein
MENSVLQATRAGAGQLRLQISFDFSLQEPVFKG